jgi:hypothetical protein
MYYRHAAAGIADDDILSDRTVDRLYKTRLYPVPVVVEGAAILIDPCDTRCRRRIDQDHKDIYPVSGPYIGGVGTVMLVVRPLWHELQQPD